MTLYYTTKYALTKGIEEVECGEVSGGVYVYSNCNPRMPYQIQFKAGYNAFLLRQDAEVAANQMRFDKLRSLAKSIEKLEKLDFRKKTP